MTPLDYQDEAEDTAAVQRALQAERRQTDKNHPLEKPQKAMQAGARKYPEPPLPDQTLDKPGSEADMDLKPFYDAPFYKGSGKLEGKVALITGGDSGIGRAVSILFAREGADVAIVFLDEHEDAELTRSLVEAEGQRCLLISGDVSDRTFAREAVAQTVTMLGKLDVLVNNAAFQLHARFEDISEEQFDRTLKTNLYGYFQMAQAAVEHLPYGGAIGADPYLDRAGIQCRTVRDTALVLDAVRDPKQGYFDPRDVYSALPGGLVSKQPYASYTVARLKPGSKPLAGLRIGIGHPGNKDLVLDYVLGRPSQADARAIDESLERAQAALQVVMESGWSKGSQLLHTDPAKVPVKKPPPAPKTGD